MVKKDDYFYESVIFRGSVYFVFLAANLYAVYLFFRGHNLPGGGFIAGVCSSLSMLLLAFVVGLKGLKKVIKTNLLLLAAVGVAISFLTLIAPLPFGDVPLQHYHFKRETFLLWKNFYLGTPIIFDLGVYLTVFGTLSFIILELGRVTNSYKDQDHEDPDFSHTDTHENIETAKGGISR